MFPRSARKPPERVVVILNPRAGRGEGARWQQLLRARQPDWEIWPTTFAGEATFLARRAAQEGADLVVAAGGDGTLGEVLNGIHGAPVKLGVLPLGTGNDFARGLGIRNPQSALEILCAHHTRFVDCGRAHFAGESRLWLNVSGAGFDGRVAARINNCQPAILKRLRGPLAYLVAAGAELRELQAFDLRLSFVDEEKRGGDFVDERTCANSLVDEGSGANVFVGERTGAQQNSFVDERTIERRALLCAVANAQSYGGGMRVAPDALVDDGFFDVCLINQASRTEFARAFPSVFRGKHVGHSKVETFRARSVLVESEPALAVLVDGEIAGTTPVRFEMLARSVELVAPAGNADIARGFG